MSGWVWCSCLPNAPLLATFEFPFWVCKVSLESLDYGQWCETATSEAINMQLEE